MKRPFSKKINISKPLSETTNATEPILDNTQGDKMGLFLTDNALKKFFYLSLFVMLLFTLLSGFNVGYHQDEIDMNAYGKACCSFYTTGGNDTSYLGNDNKLCRIDSFLKYYGSGFEYFARAANKLSGNSDTKQEFNVRHLVNQFFGIIALLYAGLVAYKLFDWRVAIVTIWLAFCSPSFFGHVFFNTKDIPFCTGYLASMYYVLCFLKELPAITWKTTLKLMLAIAFTSSVRIAGIIWVFYLLLFSAIYIIGNRSIFENVQKNIRSIILKYIVVISGAWLLVVLSWPFFIRSPFRNMLAAIELIKKYPMRININFSGETINSLTIPANYIPKLLGITTPVFILIFLLIGLIFVFFKTKKESIKPISFLLFSALFPLIYAIFTHAVMYTGWRHFLFIYPYISVIAAVGVVSLYTYLSKPLLRVMYVFVSVVLMLSPVIWSIRNHPYEYCYFNELSGGYKNVYYNYDTDYWQITMKNAIDKMMMTEQIGSKKDTVVIATNIPFFVEYYVAVQYPEYKVKIKSVGCAGRNLEEWHYAVFNNYLLKPDYLENYFPPKTTICSENIDGIASTIILRDTLRLDLKAVNAMNTGDYVLADKYLMQHILTTHDENPVLYAYVAFIKSNLNQNDEAIDAAKKSLNYHFSNDLEFNANCALAIAYGNKKQFDQSIEALNAAEALIPGHIMVKDIFSKVNAAMEQEKLPPSHK